jgi:hypothetical protein
MASSKVAGALLVAGAAALFIPYTILTQTFEYPDILRQDTTVILTKFHEGSRLLIVTWFAFALSGLPLIPGYILVGRLLRGRSSTARVATTFGVVGLIVQMAGLLRWTFVVPVIADLYVNSTDPAIKAAAIVTFKAVHQYGGVLLGEHLGQLFTIVWTILISIAFGKLKFMPRWLVWSGYAISTIYFLAQAELLATVIPGFPYWDLAGFLGSTLWLVWVIIVGAFLIKSKINTHSSSKSPSVL